MAGINKVIIVGNLCGEPEVKHAASGTAVANFSVATNETWKNKDGTKEEKVEFHRVVAFGKLAEICGEYLHTGKLVYIEGRIQTRSWDDKDGKKCYMTEVVAQNMQMLSGKGEGRDVPGDAPEEDPDDIPF